MASKQNVYIYNPVNPRKDLGRRTGLLIRKKRNVYANIENFDDYLTDSDEEKSINVTKHLEQSVTGSADVSYGKEITSSASDKNKMTKATESCLRKDATVNNHPFLLPEGFSNVRIINPLAAGSRYGRRTGKDILAKKAAKVLAGSMNNFSDYLSDTSDISDSLHVTQIQSPAVESPSTSAKESDGKMSPEVCKDGPQLLKSPICADREQSHSFYAPNNSGITSLNVDEKGRSSISNNKSSRRKSHANAENQLSNQSDQNLLAAKLLRHTSYTLTETATSGSHRSEGLQTHSSSEESAFTNRDKNVSIHSESYRTKLDNSGLKRCVSDNTEEKGATVYTPEVVPEVVTSSPEKENILPRSSSQAGKSFTAGQVPAQPSGSRDHSIIDRSNSKANLSATEDNPLDRTYSKVNLSATEDNPLDRTYSKVNLSATEDNPLDRSNSKVNLSATEDNPIDKSNSKVNLRPTEDNSLDRTYSKVNLRATEDNSLNNKSYKKVCAPVVSQPATVDSDKVRCVDTDKKTQTDCRANKQNVINNEVKNNTVDSDIGAPEKTQIVKENDNSNAKPETLKCKTNVDIVSLAEPTHAVNEPQQLTKPIQVIDVGNQSGATRNMATSPEATLNFGGNIKGSVSNSEKANEGQFFGIRKRLSYSSAMIENEQRNEKPIETCKQTKILPKVEKQLASSVGSFVGCHGEISVAGPSRVSGKFVTVASQSVSQNTNTEKSLEPLKYLNTNNDSVEEFCILEEKTTEQNVFKAGKRDKKICVPKNNTGRKKMQCEKNEEASKIINSSVTVPSRVSGKFVTVTSQSVSQNINKEKLLEPRKCLNASDGSVDEFRVFEEQTTEHNVVKARTRGRKTHVPKNNAGRKNMQCEKNDEASQINQTKKDERKRSAKLCADIETANELSEQQSRILQESCIGNKRRVTAKLTKGKQLTAESPVSSLSDPSDKLNMHHPEAAVETNNFICLAPQRVSQLVAEVHKERLIDSQKSSSESFDDGPLEKIITERKPSTAVKRSKQVQERNKTKKSRITHTKKTRSQAHKNVGKRKRNLETNDNSEQVESESESDANNKVPNNPKKQDNVSKKTRTVDQVKQSQNDSADLQNNTKDVNIKQNSTLLDISKDFNKKSKLETKQTKVNGSINLQTVEQLKKGRTSDWNVSDLHRTLGNEHLGGHDVNVTNSLPPLNDVVQMSDRSNDTAAADNNLTQREIRPRHNSKPIQYPFHPPETKATIKAKQDKIGKVKIRKQKKSRKITTNGEQNCSQINITTEKSPAKHSNLNAVALNSDNINLSTRELQIDPSSMKSNNSLNGNSDTQNDAENGELNHIEKCVNLDRSSQYQSTINSVVKQVKEKSSTENCIDNPQSDLDENRQQLSPPREFEASISRIEVCDVSVPVNLSSGKKNIAAKLPSSGRKRQSLKTKGKRRKPVLNSTSKYEDCTTPVKLQLISSLPRITPKSGISFIRSQRYSSRNMGAGKDSPAAAPAADVSNTEHSTPQQTQKKVSAGLSSCLKKRDSTVPKRRGKGRRVRISNFIHMKEWSQDENNCSGEEPTMNLPSLTSSPVHYGEVTTNNVFTTSKSPNIVVPDLSYKIVRPSVNPQGLRRSARTRVKRVQAYKGEQIVYRRDSTDFELVVDHIQPSLGEARVKAAEARRRRKLLERKSKAMRVPAKPAKRLSAHWLVDQDVTVSSEIPVVNPDNNEKVLLELIARDESVTWYGPDLEPVTGTEPVAICTRLKQPMFTTGEMHMRALAEKPSQLTEHTLIYNVIHGKICLKINDVSTIVETGANFFIPRGTMYSLKNLRRDIAKLHFVDMNDNAG